MRRDFMEEKQKDVDEIRRLSNIVIRNNQTLADKMTINMKMGEH